MQTKQQLSALITETAELISSYNPKLASVWLSQPFQRANVAQVFAAGFSGDFTVPNLVTRVARADAASRALDEMPSIHDVANAIIEAQSKLGK